MLKWLYVALGHVFLVTGVIGIFTPIIPGTPLIILAAVLYAKGSTTFYNWLINHKYLGSIVKRWQESDRARFKMRVTLIAGATLDHRDRHFYPRQQHILADVRDRVH